MDKMADTVYVKPKRTAFLTVLCILSFMGSAWGIFSSIIAFAGIDEFSKNAKQATERKSREAKAAGDSIALQNATDTSDTTNKKTGQQDTSTAVNKGRRNNEANNKFMLDALAMRDDTVKVRQNAVAGIITNLITFIGAFLMFRMNRRGFWVYVLGIIAWVAAPVIIFGSQNTVAAFMAYIPGFFGLVFIIMYAFNLRDMKPQPLYD